jgi:hypothetical protein
MMNDTDTDTDASASASAASSWKSRTRLFILLRAYLPTPHLVRPFPCCRSGETLSYVRARLRASSPPARHILTVSVPPLNREYARQGGRRSV